MTSSASALSASIAPSSLLCSDCNNLRFTRERIELYNKLRQNIGQIARCVVCNKERPSSAIEIETELFSAHEECSSEALKFLTASPRLTHEVISAYKFNLRKPAKFIHSLSCNNFPVKKEEFKIRRSVSCVLKA